MKLCEGWYLSLDAAQGQALRKPKSGPLRRKVILGLIDAGGPHVLPVGDGGSYLQHLFKDSWPSISAEKPMLRGERLLNASWWLHALPAENLKGMLPTLEQVDEPALRRRLQGTNEEDFRYSWLPGWVKKKWDQAGKTTIKDEATAVQLWKALQDVRSFWTRALEQEREVVFACDWRAGK